MQSTSADKPAPRDPQLELSAREAPTFITDTTTAVNGSLRDFYEENGYLVMPDALSPDELDELNAALKLGLKALNVTYV